jgi:hypothetical protein
MKISKGTQLGLMFGDKGIKLSFFEAYIKSQENSLEQIRNVLSALEKRMERGKEAIKVLDNGGFALDFDDNETADDIINNFVKYNKTDVIGDLQYEPTISLNKSETKIVTHSGLLHEDNCRNYLICESVFKAAELVKIGGNFTSRTFKDVYLGVYTYLLGKTQMVRFKVGIGLINGFYYDSEKGITFDFFLNISTGSFLLEGVYDEKIFTSIMKIMTFVELGDIEIVTLEAGRNNGKPKNAGKITNTANNTVYVVDSSWNQMIIRTTGFAVRGHFRLQPCGPENIDRKLLWISAFEKHGYKRRPKAEIII